MIIARWYVYARFGRKQELIEKVKQWWQTIGKEIGQTDCSIYTGSVGAEEALVTVDVRVKDMAELDAQWAKLAERADHHAFSKEVEPLLVSGRSRWEILRAID